MNNREIDEYLSRNFKEIDDSDFMLSVRKLYDSPYVDIPTFLKKLDLIKRNAKQIENAKDLVVEFKVARNFLSIPNLNQISFGENPDLNLKIGLSKLSVEVKRFRYRKEDTDDQNAFDSASESDLISYGDSENVQLQLEDALIKKATKYKRLEPFFVYLWSDSFHEVEDCEILCACRTVFAKKELSNLFGVFIKVGVLIVPTLKSANTLAVACLKDTFYICSAFDSKSI